MSDNVISLSAKKAEKKDPDAKDEQLQEEAMTFEEIQARNRKNAERVAKERSQANKSVLRSYRIKS